jgi:hypothetical protein
MKSRMNSLYVVAGALEPTDTTSTSGARVQLNKAKQHSPYALFLRSHAAELACNVNERADVKFAAILGYN